MAASYGLDRIIQRLSTTRLRSDDLQRVSLDSASVEQSRQLQENSYYGRLLHGAEINFRTLQTILDCVWTRSKFCICQISPNTVQFFFTLHVEIWWELLAETHGTWITTYLFW